MSFSDISKTHNDFFSENFPIGWNAEWVSNGANKNSLTVSAKTDGKSSSATFKPKWTLRNYNLEFKPTFDTNGAAKLELVNTDKIAKGVKVSTVADATKKEIGTSVEYNNEDINLKGTISGPWAQKPELRSNISALYNHKDCSVGGSADISLGSQPKLTSASIGFRHSTERYTSSTVLTVSEKKVVDGGFVYHLQSSKGDVAAKFNYDIEKKSSEISIGFSHVTNDNNTWKTKVNSSGRAGVSHSHQWNEKTKVTSSVDLDLLNPADHKFGVQIKFSQ